MSWLANPWRLTPAEIAALDAYVAAGSEKGAAASLGKDQRTIGTQLGMARVRMGARTRMHCVLEWDRWRRSQAAGQTATVTGV